MRAVCQKEKNLLKKEYFVGNYVPVIVKRHCRTIVIVLPAHDRKIYNFFTVLQLTPIIFESLTELDI